MPGSSSTIRTRVFFTRGPPPPRRSRQRRHRNLDVRSARPPDGYLPRGCARHARQDVADDRQTQAGAAALGGKIRQEQLFLVAGGDSAAGVGHQQLHRVRGGGARGHQQPLDQRIPHGFGRVVHQVHHHAFELLRIDVDRRQIGRQIRRAGRCHPAGRRRHPARCGRLRSDRRAPVARPGSARTARIRRPASSPIPLRAKWSPRTPAGCAANPASNAPRSSWRAMRSAESAIGRERILQFMRDPPGDFMPGRGLLRAQQFAGVFEHHDEARARPARAPAARKPSRPDAATWPGRFQIDLAGGHAGAPRALHQIVDFGGVLGRKQIAQVPARSDLLLPETGRAARDSRAGCGRRRSARSRRWECFRESLR